MSRSNYGRRSTSPIDLMFVLLVLLVLVSLFAGFLMRGDGIGGPTNTGLPIHDIAITSDGLTLTFFIGSEQWQATLNGPTSRPPNMEQAAFLFVDGNRLQFTNSEGQTVFKDPLIYINSLTLLEG